MPTNKQRRAAAKRKLERQLTRRAQRARRRRITTALVGVGAVIAAATLVAWSLRHEHTEAPSPPQIEIPSQRAPMPSRPAPLPNPVSCDYQPDGETPAVPAPERTGVVSVGTVDVVLKTTAGDIPITLDRALAPCAVNSILSLAKQGFYTGTACHRLSTTGLQMLQCGKGRDAEGPGYRIPDESFPELGYGRGVVAMARTPDTPNSGGSQFFLLYGDAQLTPEYAVVGSIADSGLQTLDAVARGGMRPESIGKDGTGVPAMEVRFTDIVVDDKR